MAGSTRKISVVIPDKLMFEDLLCPLSCKLMLDPVRVVESGITYDRTEILRLFKDGCRRDPISGVFLESKAVENDNRVKTVAQSIQKILKKKKLFPNLDNQHLIGTNETLLGGIKLRSTFKYGNVRSCINYRLGHRFEFGISLTPNWNTAYRLYVSASSSGHVEAAFTVARCNEDGIGTSFNAQEVFTEYWKAAHRNHPAALIGLGWCYHFGWDCVRDPLKGLDYISRGINLIDHEDPINAYYLGRCWYEGLGVQKDFEASANFFKDSASKGYAEGQYFYGMALYKGEGVAKDIEEAMLWFDMAARQGNPWSQFWLALCYRNGYGVEENIELAEKWRFQARKANLDF